MRCARMDIGAADSECVRILKVGLDKLLRKSIDRNSHFVRSSDHFIVYIGKILDIRYLIPDMRQIAPQNIEYNKRACVSDMKIIIDGWPARVKEHLSGCDRLKEFFLPR